LLLKFHFLNDTNPTSYQSYTHATT
jgi:hypothetical protein